MSQLKLAVIADLHYYSRTLGDTGGAYERRSSTDQKCLAESGAITEAIFAEIAASDCDAVLIAGDLSNDGEKVSHAEVREKIANLAKSKPVYVVYATHDWCNSDDAARYEGEEVIHEGVPTMTPPELREYYWDYGPKDALSEHVVEIGASSYCVKVKEGFRILGINDDKNGKGRAGYTDEHFAWILDQIREAKEAGDTVIAMQHHLIMPGISMLVNGGQMIADAGERADAMADAGLEYIFVGHSHMQRISSRTSENGNKLWQINLGSSSGYPAPWTMFTVDDTRAFVDVNYLKEFTFDGLTLTDEYIKDHTLGVIKNIIDNADKGEAALAEQLRAYGLKWEKVGVPYSLVRIFAQHVKHDSVKQIAGYINKLTFGKGIDKEAADHLDNVKLADLVYTLFLNVFDGSVNKFAPDTAVYRVVTDAASLPRRFTKLFPIRPLKKGKPATLFRRIEKTAKEVLWPSGPDNQHAVLDRRK
ncbi:MAG: metallophosphoesterase [Clostridia bacterium]|nr:metallophosphoesterase [Clostridia bacterium]